MDPIISKYPFVPFGELNYCHTHGLLYQQDMSRSVKYDKHYFETYVRLENTEIARKLNEGRTSLTEKYCDKLLDVGVGSGEFIKSSNVRVLGYDINPVAVKWLKKEGLYADPYAKMPAVKGITLWDTLEHIPNPAELLSRINRDCYLFVSLPIFDNLLGVRQSKHYKPDEHYYYWTASGLIDYMKEHSLELVEISDHETRAGRESILTFVFLRS
jgi:hypothetical protein